VSHADKDNDESIQEVYIGKKQRNDY